MAFDTDENTGFFARYKLYFVAAAVLAAGAFYWQRSNQPMGRAAAPTKAPTQAAGTT